jgi:hypothetical protein
MASSGRYQSHLFNFLNRQVQKVSNQTRLTVRHLKVAAVWGTQILVYPVYALYQTTRIAGRQLQQNVRRTATRLHQSQHPVEIDPLAIDAPIYLVNQSLTAVLTPPEIEPIIEPVELPPPEQPRPFAWLWRWLPGRPTPRSLPGSSGNLVRSQAGGLDLSHNCDRKGLQTSRLPHTSGKPIDSLDDLPVQAVACMVDTRHLVVILENNVIYDVLTLEQQHRLQQQITIELASLSHRRREYVLQEMPAAVPLPVPADRPMLFPPLRIFHQLMGWIQRSPVAIATNLFQESTFIDAPSADWFNPDLTAAPLPGRENPRLPSSGDLKKAVGQLPRWTDMEAFIWAAIHYFFGNSGRTLNAPTSQQLSGKPEALPRQLGTTLRSPAIADPWLSLKDLFQPTPPSVTLPTPAIESASFLATEVAALPSTPSVRIGQSIQSFIQRYLKPRFAIRVTPKEPHTPHPTPHTPSGEIIVASPDALAAAATAQPLEASASDWIEAKATAVEYLKSPWQALLDWLDRGIRWIEEKLIGLWQWLMGR